MDYDLYGLERLKWISVAEIILGILSFIGFLVQRGAYSITSGFLTTILLLGAGILGLITVLNAKKGNPSATKFRIVTILNAILACFGLVWLILSLILAIITLIPFCQQDCLWNLMGFLGYNPVATDVFSFRFSMFVTFLLIALFSGIFAGVAAVAAYIARRNARVLLAGVIPVVVKPQPPVGLAAPGPPEKYVAPHSAFPGPWKPRSNWPLSDGRTD